MTQRLPIAILGTGSFVPDRVITNQHFAEYLDTSDEWITTRTGIKERRWVSDDESTSTMAVEAARRALDDAGMTADQLDLIICCTATPDQLCPPTATWIQGALGCHGVASFDLSAACSGFIYGMIAAAGFVVSGMHRRVLVVGAETLSRFADPQDRTVCVLFGDAAGAAVIGPAEREDQGIWHWELGCDGSRADHIVFPAGGSRLPTSASTVAENLQFIRMKGREVFKFAVGKMQDMIDRALAELKIEPSEIALVIPHQSNLRIIESARDRLGLPREKVAVNIDRCGNTSAASVPLALDDGRRKGQLRTGDLVIMLGVGAGLTWGLMAVRL